MLKGNKGEWSEVYVLLYLLTTGKLYSSDENLNKIEDIYFPVKEIYKDDGNNKTKYSIQEEILIYRNDILETKIKKEELVDERNYLLEEIKNNKGTFNITKTEKFMQKIMCYKLTSPNTKADINIKIIDINTGFSPTVGFSIKSKLGEAATLLNASDKTNFVYEIENSDEEFKEKINRIIKVRNKKESIDVRARVNKIINNKKILFSHVKSETFKNNLEIIDSNLAEIISYSIIYYYNNGISDLKTIIKILEKNNPMRYGNIKAYKYKMKKFLSAVALGMYPNKEWNGIDESNGGYIVVRKDGEVLAYHLYNRDKFEEYLLRNTKFDTPSTSRHKFGKIYKENNKYYINLNIQIRFK